MIAPVRFLMYSWWESSMVRARHPPLSSSLESKRKRQIHMENGMTITGSRLLLMNFCNC